MMIPVVPDGSDPRMWKPSRLATLYLSLEEIDAIAIAMAYAINSNQIAQDARDASRIIWNTPTSAIIYALPGLSPAILTSLATMFAELREQLTLMMPDGPNEVSDTRPNAPEAP